MIDPILSLSFSLHSNKGVYALLLGSGVSRAAEIPTGWEVVLDLVRKLAHILKEDPEPDPVAWYEERFERSPDYSDLLDQLAKTPSERNQLLRGYFEPEGEDEREQGVKVPTEAHKAIAELVANGQVRVILTTNFDRLLEKALEAADITPTVISTPEAVEGTMPLQHNACSIIKLHGDYLDTRIKNTPEELAEYDEVLNHLLDRVFDEYGLIVCGWSADYDAALRAALERCKNHRFTTYWASRGNPGVASRKIITLRKAQVISIQDAETFFVDLAEKVSALDEYSRPHPLSSKLAVASLKKYLANEGYRIRLHDLVMAEVNKVREGLVQEDLLQRYVRFPPEQVVAKARSCESLSEIAVSMMATGCYWGGKSQEYLWARCLERLASIPGEEDGRTRPHLGLYPALLALYAGGLAAIAAENYSTFSALLTRAKVRQLHEEQPLVFVVHPANVLDPTHEAQKLPGMERHYTPLNDHLHDVLREPLKEFLPQDLRYERCFDRFEYLLALVCADLHERQGRNIWGPLGRYSWRDRGYPENHVSAEIESEATTLGEDWPPFKAGLFDGSVERLLWIKEPWDKRIADFQGVF